MLGLHVISMLGLHVIPMYTRRSAAAVNGRQIARQVDRIVIWFKNRSPEAPAGVMGISDTLFSGSLFCN